LRRHVTGLGTAVNVDFPDARVAEEGVNPWGRIVACGLEGRGVTSVRGELGGGLEEVDGRLRAAAAGGGWQDGNGGRERMVAGAWAEELARRVGLEGVDVVDTKEVVELIGRLVREGESEGDWDVEGERSYVERMAEVYSAA
jgi:lipoyl(octanoyl) transferase